MCANGYKFKTYAPKAAQLVDFPAGIQHFSMDYYLENLHDGIELLEELMGEKDYGAFLDTTDNIDNPKMQIVWPAIFKDD